jgi:hypothetical protein
MVISLLGQMRLENWEFRNHFYYHLPQSAGDFTSQASRLMAAYYFWASPLKSSFHSLGP